MHGNLFVISAPSGAGKTTVIKRLLLKMPDAVLSVSATTRLPRAGEKNGVDYHFVTKEEFKQLIANNEMLEWAVVHEAYYGTPKAPIDSWIEGGKTVVLDIDVQGGKNIKKTFPQATLIFLMPPSRDELVRRLTLRNANDPDDLKVRIKNADVEMAQKNFYDHVVVNDDLEKAVDEVLNIIKNK